MKYYPTAKIISQAQNVKKNFYPCHIGHIRIPARFGHNHRISPSNRAGYQSSLFILLDASFVNREDIGFA